MAKKKVVQKKGALKKKKQPKKIEWKTIDHKIYDDVIEHLVHFSSKPVNTNAQTVGVRLAGSPIDLPYLSVSTVGPDNVETDYLRNSGTEAAPFKQIRAIRRKQVDDFAKPEQADVTHVRKKLKVSKKKRFEYQTERIDPRLRQLLWPVEEGGYVSLTPLPSAGLSTLIAERTTRENDNARKEAQRDQRLLIQRRSDLAIGGANSQNAGGLVYMMTSPLLFHAPKEDLRIKRAYSYFYNGIRYRSLHKEIGEFAEWHVKHRQGEGKNTVYVRQQSDRLLRNIAWRLINIASDARRAIALLALDEPCHPDLDSIQKGLLNPAQRNTKWRQSIAQQLAEYVVGFKPFVNDERVSLGIADAELGPIATVFEEVLL